jgi:probable HAF family extracellular repeat protein
VRAVRFCFLFCIVSILALRAASSLAAQYTLTDVGFGINSAINASGQLTWFNGTAILWTPTTPNGTSGTTTDLGLLGGTSYSFGAAINASGQVMGGFSNDGGISGHGVVWTPNTPNGTSGTVQEYSSGKNISGLAINDSGQLTGQLVVNGYYPFMYDGTVHDLGLLGTGDFGWGNGINNYGQVAGFSNTTVDGDDSRAILWQPTTPNSATGTMHDLGTIGGSFADGRGINASGQVTGSSTTTGDAANHAMVWTPTTPNGISGNMIDLGTLGGTNSEGLYINASGQVLGDSDLAGDAAGDYFLYTPGSGMVDFSSLVDPLQRSAWDPEPLVPEGINDAGQITGYGRLLGGDGPSIFLLTPVPEPATFSLALVGAGLLLHCGRRRRSRPAAAMKVSASPQ